jgi:hypothetical protein
MMETINDRIRTLIKALGFENSNQFDKALNKSRNTTHSIVGPRNSKPGADFIETILTIFTQVDARWLLTGYGEMFSPDKFRREYVENLEEKVRNLEQKMAVTSQEKVRLEILADSLISQRNFQRLSRNAPVGRVIERGNFYLKTA